ncbi:MFS transporter [Maribacter polysaccharolyticus]|uniref:MFS transporter n=1 Tax=Maribacter polysaccharolyticus TaxID=3020831 RepID=UPI00237FA0B6|nr:MFS transporter [Maribacter polysaccharolyticus]MDE3743245.1 MFS transporter [Maribacter polysaccharolyticus]
MKEKLQTLKIVHFALCIGVTLAYFVVGDFTISTLLEFPELDTEAMVFICIAIAAVLMGNFLFKAQLEKIDRKKSLEEKIPYYQSAALVRWALMEGAAFLILFLKPGLVVFGIFIIAYMVFLHPTEARIKNELQHTGGF